MLQEQMAALHVGDEVVHQSGLTRRVVGLKRSHHVIVTPKLRGSGKTAHVNWTQFAGSHSLPATVLVPEKGKAEKPTPAFDVAANVELFFILHALNRFHQKGMIPHCEPRIEAYFQLLETWLEDNEHASRD